MERKNLLQDEKITNTNAKYDLNPTLTEKAKNGKKGTEEIQSPTLQRGK